jgi:hypothetical protein
MSLDTPSAATSIPNGKKCMNKEWSLAVVLVVALTAPAALAQGGSSQPSHTVPGPAGPAASGSNQDALPATTIRVRGTIKTYDADGAILALTTPNGLLRFPVAAQTRVRHAGQTVDRAELKTLTGLRAAVRYSESGGRTTVESVNVFDTTERNRR